MKNYAILLIFVIVLMFVLITQKNSVDKKRSGNLNNLFSTKIHNILTSILGNQKENESCSNISRKFDSPNFSNENFTEFTRRKLVDWLGTFGKCNQQRNLGKNCTINTYIWNTTDKFLKDELNQISKIVIERLNKQNLFDFNYSGYGDIKVIEEAKPGLNKNYKYEIFLWDKKNFFQIKVFVDLIKYTKKSDLGKSCDYSEQSKLIFPYYPIGIPKKEQLIPDPMSVIPSGNDILDTKCNGVNFPVPSPIEYLYINSISVDNSTLIINSRDMNRNTLCGGFADGSESFSFVKGDHDPYIEPAVVRNRWPRLPNQPFCVNTWPCTPQAKDWDMHGVSQPDVQDSQECPGKTWAAQRVPAQPNFNPTIPTLPRNCGENFWLFDLTNGNGASASSASQPAP